MEEVLAHNVVDSVVPASFQFTVGCNQFVLKQVKKRVRTEAATLFKQQKHHLEIILNLKARLQAIYHGEKLLYDTARKNPAKGRINIHYSDSSDEEGDCSSRKVPVKKNEDKKETSTQQYYSYLCKYKNDLDVYSRVQALEIRGKNYRISKNGACPKCSYKENTFVILDFLFPAGDMPEMLQFLMARGKAVLWSSKEHLNVKDPPTFLCNGKCPNDAQKCGFNINWETTDLEKIFLFPDQNYVEKPSDKLDIQQQVEKTPEANEVNLEDEEFLKTEEESEEEYEEGLVDIEYYRNKVSWVVLDEIVEDEKLIPGEEEGIIRTMLALEEARNDYISGEMKTLEDDDDNDVIEILDSSSPEVVEMATPTNTEKITKISLEGNTVPAVTSPKATLPVLTSAKNVQLTHVQAVASDFVPAKSAQSPFAPGPTHILKGAQYYGDQTKTSKPAFTASDFPVSKTGLCPYCHSNNVVYIILQEDEKEELPELLKKLQTQGNATVMKKGTYDLPSFQCRNCTYGFNLDWTFTSLEKIFTKNVAGQPGANLYPSSYQGYYPNEFYPTPMYPGFPPYLTPNAWMRCVPPDPYYGAYSWQVPPQIPVDDNGIRFAPVTVKQATTSNVNKSSVVDGILPTPVNVDNAFIAGVNQTVQVPAVDKGVLPIPESDSNTVTSSINLTQSVTSDEKLSKPVVSKVETKTTEVITVEDVDPSEVITIADESDMEVESDSVEETSSKNSVTEMTADSVEKTSPKKDMSGDSIDQISQNIVVSKAPVQNNIIAVDDIVPLTKSVTAENDEIADANLYVKNSEDRNPDIIIDTKHGVKNFDSSPVEGNLLTENVRFETGSITDDMRVDVHKITDNPSPSTDKLLSEQRSPEIFDTIAEMEVSDSANIPNSVLDTIPATTQESSVVKILINEKNNFPPITSGHHNEIEANLLTNDNSTYELTVVETVPKILKRKAQDDEKSEESKVIRVDTKHSIEDVPSPSSNDVSLVRKPEVPGQQTEKPGEISNTVEIIDSPFTESLVNLLTQTDESDINETSQPAHKTTVELENTDSMSPKSDLFDLDLDLLASTQKVQDVDKEPEVGVSSEATATEEDGDNEDAVDSQPNRKKGGSRGRGRGKKGRGRGRGRKKGK